MLRLSDFANNTKQRRLGLLRALGATSIAVLGCALVLADAPNSRPTSQATSQANSRAIQLNITSTPVVKTQTNPFAIEAAKADKTSAKHSTSKPVPMKIAVPASTRLPATVSNSDVSRPPKPLAGMRLPLVTGNTVPRAVKPDGFSQLPARPIESAPAATTALGLALQSRLQSKNSATPGTTASWIPAPPNGPLPQGPQKSAVRLVDSPALQIALNDRVSGRVPLATHSTPVATHSISDQSISNQPTTTVQPHSVSTPPMGLMPASTPDIPKRVSHGSFGRYLNEYRARAFETENDDQIEVIDPSQMFAKNQFTTTPQTAEQLSGFDMWWESALINSIGISPQTMPIDIASLTQTALASSPYVRAILTEPHISRSEIVVADAEFDSTAFLEGKFTDTNEPVGSDLTTGDNSDRFRDETYSTSGGLRKKTRVGGEFELSQRGGFQKKQFDIP